MNKTNSAKAVRGVCTRDQLPRDQFLPDQLCMKSTLSRSTLIESTFQMINSTRSTEINCPILNPIFITVKVLVYQVDLYII